MTDSRSYPGSTSGLLTKAGDAFEFIRLKLINCLNEPERSAFWKAVEMRDLLRPKTLGRQTTTSVLPHGEGQAVECDGGLRTFDTKQTVLRRSGNVFTITCDDGEVANRVADQLRTGGVAQQPVGRGALTDVGPDFRVVPVRVLQSAYDRIDAMLASIEADFRAANSVRIELRHLINEAYALPSTEGK